MQHPRVVQLFDVFEIDENSFATVLEYCRGIDLDERLKRNKVLQEKDARMVLLQVCEKQMSRKWYTVHCALCVPGGRWCVI